MSIIASRTKLLGTALGLALLLGTSAAQAETPPNVLVVAQSIDDAVSFDPAEGFELTTVQSFNNLYQRLVQSNREDGTKIEPALAASWAAGGDGRGAAGQQLDVVDIVAGARLRRRCAGALGLDAEHPVFQAITARIEDQGYLAMWIFGQLVVVVPGRHPVFDIGRIAG